MTVTKTFITAIASEFANESESRISTLVGIAENFVNTGIFGAKADYAVALYVCHMLALDKMKGGGAVAEKRLGKIAKKFHAPGTGSKNYSDLRLTSYGAQFLAVQRSVKPTPIVT